MASVNILVDHISRSSIFGGMVAVFHYANGLVDMGHHVRVIPITPSEQPDWFHPKFEIFQPRHPLPIRDLARGIRRRDLPEIRKAVTGFLSRASPFASYAIQRASDIEWLRDKIPDADATLATHYRTAVVNALYGKGAKFYFAQHYEPLFSEETENPTYARLDAEYSYRLPLHVIANSSWLARELRARIGIDVPVCVNAIDPATFHPEGVPPDARTKFVVVSYGGRKSKWKGLEDAAQALRLARREIPNLEWRVFGDVYLPPTNDIYPYTRVGVLGNDDLRREYSTAHVALCPSWYESFPLYPLEAMACGAAVVTTSVGTDDFARDQENALVAPPREPEMLARAVVQLFRDERLRKRLTENGIRTGAQFTWDRSVRKMAQLMGLNREMR